MVKAKFQSDYPVAFDIISHESGWNPEATHVNPNGTVDYGLFQINSIHANRVNGDPTKLEDPQTNIDIAYDIYKEQGCSAWDASIPSCQLKPGGVLAGQP